jgi:hypothetical protein
MKAATSSVKEVEYSTLLMERDPSNASTIVRSTAFSGTAMILHSFSEHFGYCMSFIFLVNAAGRLLVSCHACCSILSPCQEPCLESSEEHEAYIACLVLPSKML